MLRELRREHERKKPICTAYLGRIRLRSAYLGLGGTRSCNAGRVYIIGERERANLAVQTARIFYYLSTYVVQLRVLQDYALLFIRKDFKIPHAACLACDDVVRIHVVHNN